MTNSPVVGIILAGGKGSRLYPLTKNRSKPAVPIAGKFRLIDIPISNCLHSEVRKIFVLTQFRSESLNRHISRTYSMPPVSSGFVRLLAAEQTLERPGHTDWYQGSADAVRQNLSHLWHKHVSEFIILGGDHLYRMDYRKMLRYHRKHKADITLGVCPVAAEQSFRFGAIKTAESGQVVDYVEKPTDPHLVHELRTPPAFFKQFGVTTAHELIGSMGIYVFSKKALVDILKERTEADFGGGIFPPVALDKRYRTFAYFFNSYWEDIGTIRTFFDAMINLTKPNPKFDFYDSEMPIFTRPRFLPGVKIKNSHCINSILCEGARIENARIVDSIVGIRSIIQSGCRLSRVVLGGADYYGIGEEYDQIDKPNKAPGIGKNCVIEDAIIDKNAHIGNNVKILRRNRPKTLVETEHYVIKDGIVIIPKNEVIPANMKIVF